METIYYSVAHKVHILAHKIEIGAEHALKELDLSLTGYKFLHILTHKKINNQEELGKHLGITPAATSKRMNLLEQKGLIKRTINKNNKREYEILVTSQGQLTLKKAQKALDIAATKLLSHGKGLNTFDKKLDELLKPFMENCI